MYLTASDSLVDIVIVYTTFAGAAIVTGPIVRLIITAITAGVSKWR